MLKETKFPFFKVERAILWGTLFKTFNYFLFWGTNIIFACTLYTRPNTNAQIYLQCTVGENIIATIKMRNNLCNPLKMVIFPILRQQYWTFLYCPVKLSLLILFASFLMASFLKLSLFQLSRQRQLSLFLTLKGDSDKITVTFR